MQGEEERPSSTLSYLLFLLFLVLLLFAIDDEDEDEDEDETKDETNNVHFFWTIDSNDVTTHALPRMANIQRTIVRTSDLFTFLNFLDLLNNFASFDAERVDREKKRTRSSRVLSFNVDELTTTSDVSSFRISAVTFCCKMN